MPPNPKNHKFDPHYKKAKQQGYRARSAYKLLGIQKRFNIFKRAFYILDIGSAPGSWLQVAQEKAEEGLERYADHHYHRKDYKILGVDLNKVSDIDGIKTVKMDATSDEFQQEIEEFFDDELDLIISDASINKTGNSFSDHIRQIHLCSQILELAKKYLKRKGNFVVKCFQGSDIEKFYKKVRNEFHYVKRFKPKASKKTSNEIYIIGLNKK